MDFSATFFSSLKYFYIEIVLIGFLTILLFRYSIKNHSYWKDRNVPYVKPLPFVGSLIDFLRKPFHELELEQYFSLGPVYGRFEGSRPVLTVADPQLLRDIFVKDFFNFPNRRPLISGNSTSDLTLIFLEGEDWKRVRTIITPTFTTGKLKRILNIFKDCSKTLIRNFKASAQKSEPIDAKRFLGAFNLDVIANAAFSTKLRSHNDPENKFVQYARKLYGHNVKLHICLILLFPSWLRVMKFFKLGLFNTTVSAFFSDVAEQIITERRKTKQTREDFLQLLIDSVEECVGYDKMSEYDNDDDIIGNYIQDDADHLYFDTAVKKNLTRDELLAQCFIFFLAAYDTTTTLITFVMHTLATNKDIQDKAYQEIKQCLQETNGDLTYDALKNMKYIDNIISETLRLYPPIIKTTRRAGNDYKLGDSGIIIEKDMDIMIPIFALHRDPKYYPDPEKFNPERFSPEEKARRNPYAYLPFGHGPRNCIGMRFALLNTKVCLVHIISCFIIKTCPETQIPLELDSNSFLILKPKDVTVLLDIRNDCPLKILE